MENKCLFVASAKVSLLQKKSTCLHDVYLKLYTLLINYGFLSHISHNFKVFLTKAI